MAKTTSPTGTNINTERTINEETGVGISTTSTGVNAMSENTTTPVNANEIFNNFKKDAAEHFKFGIRLNSVSGKLPEGLEVLVSAEYPLVQYLHPNAKTLKFNLSNGASITF